ncbi:AMP-dependent synthetase/ligase [Haloglycomyces albus]|uniref:AMP-dependent synthetase/ligase n=1 Tax=Haloglycomyces albus TaxID=526067 RepID=UPI00046D07DB|nr:AMP-dependent synthetase/ligase [Haloglycomyces albus]
MREFSVPATVEVADHENTCTTLWRNAEEHPDDILYERTYDDGASWTPVTCAEFRDQVIAIAQGLVEAGVEPGDRVGLMSRTRYEWTLFDYSIWAAGGVTVPVYESSSSEQAKWILSDSDTKYCVCETDEQREMLTGLVDGLDTLWTIDGEPGAVRELTDAGKDSTVDINERRQSRQADDIASIIYTSGTTGRSKGCILTHRNLLADIRNVVEDLPSILMENSRLLMFLPLAHVLARIVQVAGVESRTCLGHVPDRTKLNEIMPVFKPSTLLAIPRVFEKVYNSAHQKAVDDGKEKLFLKAAATAKEYSRALEQPGGPGLKLKLRHKLWDKLVFSKLRAAVGGQCTSAISGGAPLGAELGHFFRGVGITIYEGYGLTETSPVLSINLEHAIKVGSIGRPTPGTTLRVADDGELEAKGPQVFQGYWNNEEATAKVLDEEGWFATGDLAEIDDDGFVYITGRKKDLIVTSGGKNVAPSQLEKIVDTNPVVGCTTVVGDGRHYIAALITLDADSLPDWLERHNLPRDTAVADVVENEDLNADIQKTVDQANATVSKAEQIKRFVVLPDFFSEESGELTPKMSVKRHVVVKKYEETINDLYAQKK